MYTRKTDSSQSPTAKASSPLLEERRRYWAEIRLQKWVMSSTPLYHVQRINVFRKIDEAKPFYGYWFTDTMTCKRSNSKETFESGFIMSYGRHHLFQGVYVGTTFEHLLEVKEKLRISVDTQALRRLVQTGETAHFVRPEFAQKRPVYKLDDAQLVFAANLAGFVTQLEQPDENQSKTRKVEKGDLLLTSPAKTDWMVPRCIFPSAGLPEDLYRRV